MEGKLRFGRFESQQHNLFGLFMFLIENVKKTGEEKLARDCKKMVTNLGNFDPPLAWSLLTTKKKLDSQSKQFFGIGSYSFCMLLSYIRAN